MDFYIISVGKLKTSAPESALITTYLKKCRFKCHLIEVEEKKSLSVPELKEAEAQLLLKKVPTGAFVVALDEHGELMSSIEFSQVVEKCQNRGISDICFMIGGAFGHGNAVKERADLLLSFGRMTLPHFLMRVVICEQIYRAQTLLDGHPYHKE